MANVFWYLFDLFIEFIIVYGFLAGSFLLALVAFKILVLFGC